MRVNAVRDRLRATCPDFGGRIEGAAELSQLKRERLTPQRTPAAFVLPLGLDGETPDAASGLYRQSYRDAIGVLIVVAYAGDATGAKALPGLDALIWSAVSALAGWRPADEIGVFELSRGRLLELEAGTVIYQLDFAIEDQLRIA